jgi:decaprenylphospho-beta-D-ribofuranose 2-oxidase
MPADAPADVRELTGWGRTAPSSATCQAPGSVADLLAALASSGPRGVIARGLGRSYGDSAQNAGGLVVATGGMDRVLALDTVAGTVTVEAGVTIGRLIHVLLDHGMFVPVTPGTRLVSIGGAIGADVHGKNHHRDGSIGAHVERMTMVVADGSVREVSPAPGDDPDLFWGTLGGLGLTGVVVSATLRALPVQTPWMSVDTRRVQNLDALMDALQDADQRRYSVAWVDCMAGGAHAGRGIVTSADHATTDEVRGHRRGRGDAPDADPPARLAVPGWVPPGLLNRWSVSAFNEAWYLHAPHRRIGELQSPATFFHPLDGVEAWNRLYGRAGMVQYQCVVPTADTVADLLSELREAGAPSFLAVLKKFGPGNPGPLSFPRPGWTLALDLPAAMSDLPQLLDRLDESVAAAGGSVYLAKDSRLRPELLATFYPRIDAWHQLRDRIDPDRRWQSDQSRRLSL